MDDLVQWLRAQLDEDEQIARAATAGPWAQSGIGEYGWGVSFSAPGAGVEADDSDQGRADADHIAAWDPARVLREIDAKRQLLDLHAPGETEYVDGDVCMACDVRGSAPFYPCKTLRLLALPHADRPGYQESWRP